MRKATLEQPGDGSRKTGAAYLYRAGYRASFMPGRRQGCAGLMAPLGSDIIKPVAVTKLLMWLRIIWKGAAKISLVFSIQNMQRLTIPMISTS